MLEASIAKLSEDITDLTKAVAELDAAMAEATKLRQEEKAKRKTGDHKGQLSTPGKKWNRKRRKISERMAIGEFKIEKSLFLDLKMKPHPF